MRYLLLFLLLPFLADAQDDCFSATNIANVRNYCSSPFEFSNIGASPSPSIELGCGGNPIVDKDVWFKFKPVGTGLFMSVEGDINLEPTIELYEGNCNGLSKVQGGCNSIAGSNEVKTIVDDLIPNRTYYLRITARDAKEGRFSLCIKDFEVEKKTEQDCATAELLCDKSPFYVPNLSGSGDINDRLFATRCNDGIELVETNSVWFKWICSKSGTLTMTLTPDIPTDDLDFFIYRMPNGINDCSNRQLVKTMMSGETRGETRQYNAPCEGATGMRDTSNDDSECNGCGFEGGQKSDNYLSPLQMIEGEVYALEVENFSPTGGGFKMTLGGTGKFKGPNADFDISGLNDFTCDKLVDLNDQSTTDTDPIIYYGWDFGNGATPSTSVGKTGQTTFDSFGNKEITLTVRTEKGCTDQLTKEVFVEPCCQDFSSVASSTVTQNASCFGYTDGGVEITGLGGQPGYQYAIGTTSDFEDYFDDIQISNVIGNLGAGSYFAFAFDSKGCPGISPFTIGEPEEIKVDIGDDITLEMGDELELNASYTPVKSGDIFSWEPQVLFPDQTILDQTVLARDNTEIKLTVTDINGCKGEDSLLLSVEKIRNLEAPNVFSPSNNDFTNDNFTIFPNKGAEALVSFQIFDRWGNIVYNVIPDSDAGKIKDSRNNFIFEAIKDGATVEWDGTSNGKSVEAGVYVWRASVRYLDGVVINYSGDITLLK